MSVGPTGGVFGSAAGAPLSQTQGSEAERTGRETAAQQRAADTAQQADQAAGIGQTDQDEQASDRDADGRRLWEQSDGQSPGANESPPAAPRQSKDATGASGNQLDLTG